MRARLYPSLLVLGGLLLPLQGYALCDDTDVDTGELDRGAEDCDSDGWKKRDGDCNDEDASISPGSTENCVRSTDDDCDGFFNEGCENAAQRGSLQGGSACALGVDAPLSAIGLGALLLFARRR